MMQQSCITLIANDPARVDPLAIDQLHATARLDGISRVVGLPDLSVQLYSVRGPAR